MGRPKKADAPAAKKTRTKKTTDAAASAKTESAIKMPSKKLLSDLLAQARAAMQDTRDISGELGAKIKDASDNSHLHKKAFASVRAADRLEPEKLADYFAHRDYYEEVLGLRKRAEAVVRLPLDDDGDVTAKAKNVNVTPFPMPTREAAE